MVAVVDLTATALAALAPQEPTAPVLLLFQLVMSYRLPSAKVAAVVDPVPGEDRDEEVTAYWDTVAPAEAMLAAQVGVAAVQVAAVPQ